MPHDWAASVSATHLTPDFPAMGTTEALKNQKVGYPDGRSKGPYCDVISDVRLPVAKLLIPGLKTGMAADPETNHCDSRVRSVVHEVPEPLKLKMKPLRLNGSRIHRKLRKMSKKVPCSDDGTTANNVVELNEYETALHFDFDAQPGALNTPLHVRKVHPVENYAMRKT